MPQNSTHPLPLARFLHFLLALILAILSSPPSNLLVAVLPGTKGCLENWLQTCQVDKRAPVFKLVGVLSSIQSEVVLFRNQAEWFESWLQCHYCLKTKSSEQAPTKTQLCVLLIINRYTLTRIKNPPTLN